MSISPRVSIIIPTYNERDNIVTIIERIDNTLSSRTPYEIVVVDDNSPDGTATIAESVSYEYPVSVIIRKNLRFYLAGCYVSTFKACGG